MDTPGRLKELALQCWYSTPFHFFGCHGTIWDAPCVRLVNIPAPIGGVIESIVRRRRRCIICGRFFWRQGAFNPLQGVNIFEEHCSAACNEIDLQTLPY